MARIVRTKEPWSNLVPRRPVFLLHGIRAAVFNRSRFLAESDVNLRQSLAFLVCFLLSLGCISSFAWAQDSTDDEGPVDPPIAVSQFRSELSEIQRQYIDDLSGKESPIRLVEIEPVGTYVDTLRGDLRRVVLANLGASNEADRAVARAAMSLLENRLAAYESAFGIWDGVRSDRWSVLNAAELDGIEAQLRQRLRLLLGETVLLPDANLSQESLALGEELRAQLEALQAERLRRASGTARLMSISEGATTRPGGTALSQLDLFTELGLELEAEKALAFEVEKSKAWDPANRALASIDEEIKTGRYKTKIVAVLRESVWRSGWPPGRGPPPGWEPPSGASGPRPSSPPNGPAGGGAAVADLRDGISAEINALARGDFRAAADGAARWSTAASWLNERVGHTETEFRGAIISLSEAELSSTITELEKLKAILIAEETRALSPKAWLTLEIRETDARIEALRSEIRNRGPPSRSPSLSPRGPNSMAQAADIAPTGGGGRSYSTYIETGLEENRLFELQRRLALAPDAAQKALILEAVEIQEERVRQIRQQVAQQARSAEASGFIHGRGISGTLLTDNSAALRTSVESGSFFDMQRELSRTISHAAFARASALNSQIAIANRVVSTSQAPDNLQFERKFFRDGPNSVAAFQAAPRFAPGGVVVDLTLPKLTEDQLIGIGYDPISGRFRLNLEGKGWQEIYPSVAPETARAALGFVLDGRVAAVDIGAFGDPETIRWAERNGVLPARETESAREAFIRALTVLSVVRYNPAIAHTEVAYDLARADELIFRVASIDARLKASESVFNGLDVREPHRLMKADRIELSDERGAKSVLWVEGLDLIVEGQSLFAEPQFEYTVYLGEKRAPRVSDWLTENHSNLASRAPELKRLEEFAVAVAVLRSALAKDLIDGAAILRMVVDPGKPSPSLICRSDVPNECEDKFFLTMTGVPDTILE